jgi:hypothetical protein
MSIFVTANAHPVSVHDSSLEVDEYKSDWISDRINIFSTNLNIETFFVPNGLFAPQ